MDLPILQAIAARTWGKEDELKALKAELATLDQKITAELAPKQEKQDFGEEVKTENTVNHSGNMVKLEDAHEGHNNADSMVAEPFIQYKRHQQNFQNPRI